MAMHTALQGNGCKGGTSGDVQQLYLFAGCITGTAGRQDVKYVESGSVNPEKVLKRLHNLFRLK